MPKVVLDGEVHLGADGVLQGWCWNPERPTDRLILEILINERVVSTLVASRFREDLRGRAIGDGYYGFIVTLTKSILDAGDGYVISARDRESGCCFWRQVRGASSLPRDFADRFAKTRRFLSHAGQSIRWQSPGTIPLNRRVSTGLGVLGRQLQMGGDHSKSHLSPIASARSALQRKMPFMMLENCPNPKASLIIIADSIGSDVLSTISVLGPTLKALEASVLLVDRGTNLEVAFAPSLFANLGYVFDGRRTLASLLTNVLTCSRGDLLIIARNPGMQIIQGLPQIVSQIRDSEFVYINAQMAKIACVICAEPFENISGEVANCVLGLEVAGRRDVFERLSECLQSDDGFTDQATVELAALALRDGIRCRAWDESQVLKKGDLGVEATH